MVIGVAYPITVNMDNMGGIFLIKNSNATTHIDVCNNFVMGCLEYGIINNLFIRLEGNLVGIFTKSLPFGPFVKLASFLNCEFGFKSYDHHDWDVIEIIWKSVKRLDIYQMCGRHMDIHIKN